MRLAHYDPHYISIPVNLYSPIIFPRGHLYGSLEVHDIFREKLLETNATCTNDPGQDRK